MFGCIKCSAIETKKEVYSVDAEKISQIKMKLVFQLNTSQCIMLHPIYSLNSTSKTFFLVLVVLSGIFSVCIILLDGMFLTIMLKDKVLRTKPNILLIMMAIPDFLTGAFILPLHAHLAMNLYNNIPLCHMAYFTNMIGYMLGLMSVIVIVFIAVEIFLSVTTPFFYHSSVTKKALIISIGACWIITIVLTIIFTVCFFHLWVIYQLCAAVLCFLLMLIVIIMYKLIQREIKLILTRAPHGMQLNNAQSDQKMMRLMYLTVTFMLCYAPYVMIDLYKKIDSVPSKLIETYLMPGSEVIALTKPVWNAFVYYFRLKIIRRHVFRTLTFQNRTYPITPM